MSQLSLQTMTGLLTIPYRRGAETLVIPLDAEAGGWTQIHEYDFRQYKARYGQEPPDPKYIFVIKQDIGYDDVEIELVYLLEGTEVTTSLVIPALTTANSSFAIDLPQGASLRLQRLRQLPLPLVGKGADSWDIIALLGNMAKLLWVIGGEKDGLRWQLQDIQKQRFVSFARSFSLNKLGEDLRVPRFPPREYSFDNNTLALYHLNTTGTSIIEPIDAAVTTMTVKSAAGFPVNAPFIPFLIQVDQEVMEVTAVSTTTWTVSRAQAGTTAFPHVSTALVDLISIADETARFGKIGHLGTNNDAQRGAIGKFGQAYRFPGAGGTGEITIPNSSDFDLPVNLSFTVEVFVQADALVTRLATGIDTVTTTIQVASIIGFMAMPPFSIQMEAEVMIVTNATGSEWTVIRGVGAIPHPIGTKVTYLPVRTVIIKGQQDADGNLTTAGWSICLGSFRGIDNNIRWQVSDGTPDGRFSIFADADVNVADGEFHHVAGVVDRTNQRMRLWMDGEERANAIITILGDLTNAEPILIGKSSSGNQFYGVLDEVRLSSKERFDFNPVLGESDDAYRKRLGIFERWMLPTAQNLLATINNLVQINGEINSFVLIEQDPPSASTNQFVRILPLTLPPDRSIDRDGNSRTQEKDVSGTPGDDPDFRDIYLLTHNRPGVSYSGDANNRRMQAIIYQTFDSLIDLLAESSVAGNLNILKSFDPVGNALHPVGRALLLSHDSLVPESLGVYAHRAGFDFVLNRDEQVYASMMGGEKLAITISSLLSGAVNNTQTTLTVSSTLGFPILVPFSIQIEQEILLVSAIASTTWTVTRGQGGTDPTAHLDRAVVTLLNPIDSNLVIAVVEGVNLHIIPENLPQSGQIQWTLISCGAGKGHFAAHPADATTLKTAITSRSRLQLLADAPGEITVKVEYTLDRRTITGTRRIQIDIAALADGATIAANGDTQITETEAIGKPEATVNPIYLIAHNVPGVNYGANPDNQKMQIALEKPLNRLLTLLTGSGGALEVLKAYDLADSGLHKVGRALRLQHSVVSAQRLGALAYQAGFGFVRRQGNEIFAAVAAAEKIEIVQATSSAPLPDELTIGTPIELAVRPAIPVASGGSYTWNLDMIGFGGGNFNAILRRETMFNPLESGLLALNATYLEKDVESTSPYTFAIRLKSPLDISATIITKDQYDLIMNILNYFHPIGIEVLTQDIRKHVVEVKDDLLNALPGYTYPDFRF